MATFTPIDYDPLAGMASQSSEILNPVVDTILSGDLPPFGASTVHSVSGQTLSALTVVGLSAGNIIEADGGTTADAIGILAYDVDATMTECEVWRTGCFNPDRLTWNAAYSTDALKRDAFEGASSPTQIIIRKRAAKTV